jgi:surface protein
MKHKTLLIRLVVLVTAMMCALGSSAYSFQSGGIYYNITSSYYKTVEVTYMDDTYYSLGAYDGSITIPSSVYYGGTSYTVTSIGDRAFYNADGLTSLSIPNTVLSIGELAFSWQEDHYTNRLTSITIPNSVKTIANDAFYKCYALQTVVIGDGVTSIGEYAFGKCMNLTNLTIGSSVTSIDANAFWGAGYDPYDSSSNPSGLTITSKAVNPPTIQSTTFPDKIYSYATLKVPSGTKSSYQSANYWRNFSYIQEFYTLDQALNVGGGNITFLSEGDYPWITLQGSGRVYAQSGNAGVSSSTSEMTATVSVAKTSILSFDFKAWGEGSNYDVCRFLIDGVEQFKYGARDNDWETYSVDLSSGNHTLTWSYSKDGSVNPTGDYFAVDNVAIAEKPEAYACYTSADSTLTFYYDTQRSSRQGETFILNQGTQDPGWRRNAQYTGVSRVVFNPSFAAARPTTTCSWFEGMRNLKTIIGMNYLNTSEVYYMCLMFSECSSLKSLNLSNFNTAKVTLMQYMFNECSSLESLDLSHFNTANVTSMIRMFYNCSGLTSLNVSGWNTANVTNMECMFTNCSGLASLDLSSWNTSNVTDMMYLFKGCSQLTTIFASSQWSTEGLINSGNVWLFYGCTSLVGGQGTTFHPNKVNADYAHIDGGPSNPGYFTDKNASQRGDVNGNNEVTIADVSALIDYLLTGDATGINMAAADCNGIDGVTIADVSALIDYLLTGSW